MIHHMSFGVRDPSRVARVLAGLIGASAIRAPSPPFPYGAWRGFAVTAIDIAPQCVEIMQARGVRDARAADLYAFRDGAFDTIVCLCNGLDKVGRLSELPRFLDRMRELLAPGGQFIADSFDLRVGADEARLAELAQKTASGRYFGEMDLRFEYRGRSGAPFAVLQVDYETFAEIAGRHGWACELLRAEGGHYLARAMPL